MRPPVQLSAVTMVSLRSSSVPISWPAAFRIASSNISGLAGQLDGGDCRREEAFLPPGKPHLLACGCLDRHAIGRNFAYGRNGLLHRGGMGADTRCLTDDGEVDVDDAALSLADEPGGVFEEDLRCGAFPLRIGGREVRADVA